jgi:outer membrane protein assembly factor BamB
MVVSHGRLFTLGNTNDEDTVWALDALTGEVQWQFRYACSSMISVGMETGPAATPAVEGNHVFTLSREGHLFCLEAETGKIVWQKNLQKEPGTPPPPFGFSGSPLILGDLLVLNVGTAGLALNKTNGNIVWQSDTGDSGYASPINGPTVQPSVIFFTRHEVVAVNRIDGHRLWNRSWRTEQFNNCADPLLLGNTLFVSSGYNHGGTLFQLGTGDPAVVWENKNLCSHFSSAVSWQGALFGFDGNTHHRDQCSLKCLDAKTGKILWTNEEFKLGSLLLADGKLILLADRGDLIIAEASPKSFLPLARAQVLGGKCWTPPALAHGLLYLRNSQGNLVCLDLRNK